MRTGRRRALTVAFGTVAALVTFGAGILVGRAIVRSPGASPADPTLVQDRGPEAAVAPELLAYALLLEVPLDLAEPRGIASAQDGMIYACGDRMLVAVERTGAVKARWEAGGEPTCVAVGSDGRIYLGMLSRLEVVDMRSGQSTAWPDLGSQAIITSIAIMGSDVYVADAGNRMVLRFDTGGTLVGLIGGDYVVPSPFFDVAAAPDGTLWVADPGNHQVRHYTAEGSLLGSWGSSSTEIDGFGGCCNPAHIAVLPCGALVTSEKGRLRIKVHEPDGKLSSVVATPAQFPAATKDLDVTTRKANGGEILVLVPSLRVVRVYVKKGMPAPPPSAEAVLCPEEDLNLHALTGTRP